MLISPLELSDALMQSLEEASAEIREQVNEEAENIASDVCKRLKKESPRDTSKYSKSWEVISKKNEITGNIHYIVRNRKHYRLTHLLEYGHLNRDGSRTQEKPHIARINDAAIAEFERRVARIVNEVQ